MEHKLEFNLKRIGLLLKNDLNNYTKPLLMTLGGAYVLISLFALLFLITGDEHFVSHEFHPTFFPFLLFGLGLFLVSVSFRELNRDSDRLFYLSLPASRLEKHLTRTLLTLIGIPLLISISYLIYAFIFNLIVSNMTGNESSSFSLFNSHFPNDPSPIILVTIFMGIHSIFFLGAITFRKLEFFKTIIFGFGILLFLLAIGYILLRILIPDLFDGMSMVSTPPIEPGKGFKDWYANNAEWIFKTLFFLIIPITLWLVGYFKLTEKEV